MGVRARGGRAGPRGGREALGGEGPGIVFVSIDGVRLFVDVDGANLVPDGTSMRERPTIVMVHGGPGFDHTPFKAHYASLTDSAQVVYYDHRGNGRSEDGPRERWTLDQWADDLRSLCDVLGIERPIVFGTSFGGFVALNYGLRHPDHPAKLILSSTTGRIHLERSLAMFERLGGPDVRAVAERFFTEPTPENLDEYLQTCGPHYTQRPRPPEILAQLERVPLDRGGAQAREVPLPRRGRPVQALAKPARARGRPDRRPDLPGAREVGVRARGGGANSRRGREDLATY